MASSRAGQFLAAAAALLAALVALTAVPRAAAQVYTINSNLTIEVVAGQKMSFAEARAYCASRGGQLATIGSLEEQQLIYSKLENKLVQHYWMGLYNPGQATTDKSAFAWLDGSTTAFRSWAVGAPDNKDSKEGKCVAVAATAETICSQCCCDYNFLCWCSSGCGYRLNTPPCGFGCEGCVTNNIYSWNDVGCDTKMGAICKLPASAALTACGATPGTTSPSSASCDACCSSNKAGTLFKKVARTGGKCVAAKLE